MASGEIRRLEANIAGARGRIAVLEASMDQWNTPGWQAARRKGMLAPKAIRGREAQIAVLAMNVREWERLLASERRIAEGGATFPSGPPRMMPGQEPYTPAEWARVRALISDVADMEVQEGDEDLVDLDPYERAMAEDRRRDERRRRDG